MKKNLKRAAILLALAALTLSCQAIPFLAPTPTPTATNTPTPTNTSTITPSPTSTNTPTPTLTPTPTPSVALVELSDGSTRYVDYGGGFALVMQPNWFPLDLTEGDIEDIIEAGIEEFPESADTLRNLTSESAEAIRVIAIDTDLDRLSGGYVSNLVVSLTPDSASADLPLEVFFVVYTATLSAIIPGAEVVDQEIEENEAGIKMGIATIKVPLESGQVALQKQALFHTPDGALVMIAISMTDELEPALEPLFEDIVDSVEFLD